MDGRACTYCGEKTFPNALEMMKHEDVCVHRHVAPAENDGRKGSKEESQTDTGDSDSTDGTDGTDDDTDDETIAQYAVKLGYTRKYAPCRCTRTPHARFM